MIWLPKLIQCITSILSFVLLQDSVWVVTARLPLFLKNPSYFLSAGSTSGILDITKFTDRWALKTGLGEYSEYPENWKNNSAIYLIENLKGFDKTIFFDCGTEDFAFDVNHAFFMKCPRTGNKSPLHRPPRKTFPRLLARITPKTSRLL